VEDDGLVKERSSEGEEGSRDGAPSGESGRRGGRVEDELVKDFEGDAEI